MCNRYETIVVMVVLKWRVEVRRLQILHPIRPHAGQEANDVVFFWGVFLFVLRFTLPVY